jgi:hypothetical protein
MSKTWKIITTALTAGAVAMSLALSTGVASARTVGGPPGSHDDVNNVLAGAGPFVDDLEVEVLTTVDQ